MGSIWLGCERISYGYACPWNVYSSCYESFPTNGRGEKNGRDREKKRSKNDNDDDSTHERSDGYCLTKYRQRFFKKDSSHARRYSEDKTSNPKLQGISSESLDPTFPRCGKRHDDWCLGIIKGCFSCGESGFKMRNCAKWSLSEERVKIFVLVFRMEIFQVKMGIRSLS